MTQARPLEFIADQFKALGHPARVRIVNLLNQQETLCVCELMRVLDFGQSFVSRHLAILREAELVTVEKHGTWAHYRLLPHGKALLAVMPLAQVSELQADLQRLKQGDCSAC